MRVKRKRSAVKIAALLCAALAIVLISSWWHSLPQPLFNTPYSSILLDRNNQLLEARIASDEQWRFPPSETLPSSYVTALLLFEDKRFYNHSGIDWLALGRATVQNIKAQKIVSGASTISMQVIRLAANSQSSGDNKRGGNKRTLTTKLFETLQALRLEFSYNKQQILNLYASHAPFGGNVVGISAASWRYFGRAPNSLSWAESALLAVLPNRPNYLRPGKNQQKLKQKRDRLLTRLQQAGQFDQLQLILALSEPLPDTILAFPKRAPHLLETLIHNNKSGLIKTSLNGNLQAQVQSVVNNYAQRLLSAQITHLAAVVLDNKTGLPIAYIGNSGFSHNPHSGKGIDLLHRPRSTGSILKPLLYATMLQQGEITPLQLVEDTPTKFKGYQPENYDLKFRGVVPAKQALAQSLNIPAVNMLKQYGIKPFYDFLKSRGMSTLHRNADDYGLPLILGGAEGTLWEMTHLYMQLARVAQSFPTQSLPAQVFIS
ncbi:MAG: penicillin-binding protein 1C [Oleispira sp.]